MSLDQDWDGVRIPVKKAAVLGGGAFGTALSHMLARQGALTLMQTREADVVRSINETHENVRSLSGIKLDPKVRAVLTVEEAVAGAELILLVKPAQYIRAFIIENRDKIPVGTPILCCSKGIEQSSLLTPFEVLEEELPGKFHKNIGVLSGPSFAKEVALNKPTCVTIAARDMRLAEKLQHMVSDDWFRVYRSTDVIGLEICGAVKNVYAILSGAVDELGYGLNARAALITRGLAELARLAAKKGANPLTVAGLGGVGDLVLTCTGNLSRNFQVGARLARGEKLSEIISSMSQVAEGVPTAKSLHELCATMGVYMPIAEVVYKVLYEDVPVGPALLTLFQTHKLIGDISHDDHVPNAPPTANSSTDAAIALKSLGNTRSGETPRKLS